MKPVKKLFIDARGRRHHLQSDTGLIWNRCLDDDNALGQAVAGLPTVLTPCATGDGWSDHRIIVRVGWPTWVSGTNPLRLVQLESLPNEVLLFILRREASADQSLSQLTLLRRAHVPDMALDYILTKSLPDGDLNPDGRVRYNAAMIHRSLHRGDSILPYLCALPRLEQQGILRKIDLSQALESDLDIIIAGQYPQSASDPLGAWAPMSSSVEQAPRLDDGARTYALANPQSSGEDDRKALAQLKASGADVRTVASPNPAIHIGGSISSLLDRRTLRHHQEPPNRHRPSG